MPTTVLGILTDAFGNANSRYPKGDTPGSGGGGTNQVPQGTTTFSLTANDDATFQGTVSYSLDDFQGVYVEQWNFNSSTWTRVKTVGKASIGDFEVSAGIGGASFSPGVEYGFRVRPFNDSGQGDSGTLSEEQWLFARNSAGSTPTPGQISAVALSTSQIRFQITTAPTGHTSLVLETSPNQPGPYTPVPAIDDVGDFPVTISGLSPGTRRYGRLKLTNVNGTVYSTPVSAQTFSGASGIFFEDDFASGDLSKTQNNFEWRQNGNVQVVNRSGAPSGKACRFFFGNPNLNTSRAELRFDLGALRQEFWVELLLEIPNPYYHHDNSFPVGSDNNKFFDLWQPLVDGQGAGATPGNYHALHLMETLPSGGGSRPNSKWSTSSRLGGQAAGSWGTSNGQVNGQGVFGNLIDPSDAGKVITLVGWYRVHTGAVSPQGESLTNLNSTGNGAMAWWKNGVKKYYWDKMQCMHHNASFRGFRYGYILGAANALYNVSGSGPIVESNFYLHRARWASSNVFGVS